MSSEEEHKQARQETFQKQGARYRRIRSFSLSIHFYHISQQLKVVDKILHQHSERGSTTFPLTNINIFTENNRKNNLQCLHPRFP